MVTSYLFIWLLLFFHAFRVKWEKSPPILLYSTLLIFFAIHLINFGFIVSGYMLNISSWDYLLFIKSNMPLLLLVSSLSQIYRVIALLVAIFIYSTVEHIIVDKRVKRAKNFWIITAIIFLIHPICELAFLWIFSPDMAIVPFIGIIQNISNFAIIFVAYIVIRYPESVLISKVQVVRALDLYKTVQSTTSSDELKEFGMPTLVNYIKNIPPELLAS